MSRRKGSPVAVTSNWGSLARWQALLDRQEPYFAPVLRGRIGLVDRDTFTSPPGAMLVWEIREGRAGVREGRFHRLQDGGCDLLLVTAQAGLAPEQLEPDVFTSLRRLIRRGEVLFFLPAGREDLQGRGFADLIETLGVPFLGTCH